MTETVVARLQGIELAYGMVRALDGVTLDIPAGQTVGLIGPDGVGKSSLLALIAGARRLQQGQLTVLGSDMASERQRNRLCQRIAYMPQGLGRNLYHTLSIFENVDFFGRLFGHGRAERERRIAELLEATGLAPFASRPAGKLSGGMKQKLGLCCSLIHDPDLLILDEPTTGIDPLSRRQFWELIASIKRDRPGMSVLVATAHMEEAARFDWLAAMNDGRILATGTPQALLERVEARSLEEAFIALLPAEQRRHHQPVVIPPRSDSGDEEVAIEAQELTKRFGDFTAVDRVSFRIPRGEIFGFLGSNGCGKTTVMKMLTGLLPASDGEAWLFGNPIDPHDLDTRRRVGYMTQQFSLYRELTVRQNLELHARLFKLPEEGIPARVTEMVSRFGLEDAVDTLPGSLPLGVRQRLSLAVAMIHSPEMLILDEPTSGVDPVARDSFWRSMVDLARNDGVTIFISTHFMNEAERCDRISLMHAGRVLVTDTPENLQAARGTNTLEEAFVGYLEDEVERLRLEQDAAAAAPAVKTAPAAESGRAASPLARAQLPLRRLYSYSRRETLELLRDPIRMSLALIGTLLLMFVVGYGITMDVEDLRFAVLDHDQTGTSRDYTLNLAGSRYFTEQPPLRSHADLDERLRRGEISLALEIPPGFAADIARGRPAEVGAWIDAAMPTRAETVRGYVEGMHQHWLATKAREQGHASALAGPATVETRFRYNPDIESLKAIIPAMTPLLLMLIPAILTALAVVREKELGSIVNLYVTPVTRLEFLLGKQLPYIVLAMFNFLLLVLFTVVVFDVPITGSFGALTLGALLYVCCSTALGLVTSAFTRSQIAALFGTTVLTLVPVVQFSGLIDPVSSLQGAGRFVGEIYPATHFINIARGVFSKGLGFEDLREAFRALLIAVPVLIALGVALLPKQER